MKLFLAAVSLAFSCLVAQATPVSYTASAVEVLVGGGHGSGVVLAHGYVLTAGHVAEMATDGVLTIKHPRAGDWVDEWTAKVVWIDKQQDFALLKINAVVTDDTVPHATLACKPPELGQPVTIAGWPVDLGLVISKGYIGSGEGPRAFWAKSYIVIGAIAPGNSGGPVYADDGTVIGLAVGVLSGTPLDIIVPVDAICDELPPGAK